MKFLLIRFSSIGDIVLTTPVIRCLKQQVPGAAVHFLTKKAFRIITESNPYIDKLHVLEDSLDAVIETLQQERFDYVIDLHHNLRTLRVKKALKVKSYSLDKLNLQKFLLTNLKVNLMPRKHIVDRELDTLAAFSVKNDGKGLDYFIPEKDEVTYNDIPAAHVAGYIGIVIGASYATKKLTNDQYITLCRNIDHPIILLGGPEDRANGEVIAATDDIKIYNSCGKFNLNESAELVRKAKVVISGDTGLMHIAAAFKKPVISVWGSTHPVLGMVPYYGDAVVPNKQFCLDLWCQPCTKIGNNRCPLGHFKCMKQQDLAAIAAAAMSMAKK
jgi:ADP-heptose:LPS heptosyltransferase